MALIFTYVDLQLAVQQDCAARGDLNLIIPGGGVTMTIIQREILERIQYYQNQDFFQTEVLDPWSITLASGVNTYTLPNTVVQVTKFEYQRGSNVWIPVYPKSIEWIIEVDSILGSGGNASDGAITTGTKTLTSASTTWVATDAGKSITVKGAGANGADLFATLKTFNSATSFDLSVNAGTTVSAAQFFWGTTTIAPPTWYAIYGLNIRFYPTPDATYAARFMSIQHFAAPVNQGDSNFWTTDAFSLIRHATVEIICDQYINRQDIAVKAKEKKDVELLRLLTGATQRRSTGRIRPYL